MMPNNSRAIRFAANLATLLMLLTMLPACGRTRSTAVFIDADEATITPLLAQRIIPAEEITRQHIEFVARRIAPLEMAASAEAWQQQAERLRRRVLEEVVFRGVPNAWRSATTNIVWDEVIETDQSYRIFKLRFEAIPNLWIPALLYEPKELAGKVPVVLNVNGHVGAPGKATDYKQLRCINLAKRGMIALNVEWLGCGQLATAGFDHNALAKLDLCGISGLSVFYQAMARGIDVLLQHPNADADRLAMTGLSGGGWQTIILSSLDTRVRLSAPNAGYSPIYHRLFSHSSRGDQEQEPTDLAMIADYTHLTAMLAPRPSLLIYNQRDNCCFVSAEVRPVLEVPVRPFFEQAGVGESFVYYENANPGTHNYDQDNRQQFYRFLNRQGYTAALVQDEEIPSGGEVQAFDNLIVPLPKGNEDFNTLAAAAAEMLPRPIAGDARAKLREVLRLPHSSGSIEWLEEKDLSGLRVQQAKLQVGDEWTLPLVMMTPNRFSGTTLLLADRGMAASVADAMAIARTGQRVVCLDPILIGQSAPAGSVHSNAVFMNTVGARPLGVQVGQIRAAMQALTDSLGEDSIRIATIGPRMGLAALCTAALQEDRSIDAVALVGLPDSLKDFLAPKANLPATPEVYCFALLEHFDLPQLQALCRRTTIHRHRRHDSQSMLFADTP